MNGVARSRTPWLIVGGVILAGVTPGCREDLPPVVKANVISNGAQGPPSAATSDMKTLIVPPAIEAERQKFPVMDYGPPSAAAADAANAKGR